MTTSRARCAAAACAATAAICWDRVHTAGRSTGSAGLRRPGRVAHPVHSNPLRGRRVGVDVVAPAATFGPGTRLMCPKVEGSRAGDQLPIGIVEAVDLVAGRGDDPGEPFVELGHLHPEFGKRVLIAHGTVRTPRQNVLENSAFKPVHLNRPPRASSMPTRHATGESRAGLVASCCSSFSCSSVGHAACPRSRRHPL